VEAPSGAAAAIVQRQAHGLTADEVYQVREGPACVNLSEAVFLGNHCVVAVSSFGSLIHTAVGRAGGSGGLRTKRSGCWV
jgi:hypothetical protein